MLPIKPLLVLCRFVPLLVMIPAWGGRFAGRLPRLAIACITALGLVGALDQPLPSEVGGWFWVAIAAKELGIGLAVGLYASLVFHAAESLGGLLTVPLTVPTEQTPSTLFGVLFVCIFFAVDGPLHLLSGMAQSYRVLPIVFMPGPDLALEALIRLGGFFMIVLMITAPLLITIGLVAVAAMITARLHPTRQPLTGQSGVALLVLVSTAVALPLIFQLAAGTMRELLERLFATGRI